MQDPKYGFRHGVVFNRQSGETIPDDEPVFVFRARDRNAVEALAHYANMVADHDHRSAVWGRVIEFATFAREHPERMKEPDTASPAPAVQEQGQ